MSRQDYPVAFHRASTEDVESILANGILSMNGQGITWEEVKAGGTGFKLCPSASSAQWAHESTFVKFGGVETSWAADGMNIAVDMNVLAEMNIQWMNDAYGSNGDTQVLGDIPAAAIIGAYNDEEVTRMGFRVSDDLSWAYSEKEYFAPIFGLLFESEPMENDEVYFNDWWACRWND
jgi:hypothetical protein